MPSCDMCGKDDELVKARIEGAVMTVCSACAKYGKLVDEHPSGPISPGIPGPSVARRQTPARKEIIQMIVSDYAQRIRQARERLGLTQQEFAKKLHEKESLMQKMESGQFKPSLKTARKLEQLLKITLIDQFEDGTVPLANPNSSDSEGMTLGDFIKKR